MIYRSNLVAPDLAPYFLLKDPPLQTMGHDMPSDPDFDPNCGFLTHDEAAILYHIAKAWPKRWVDIGARLGWTTAHLSEGDALVMPVDPELKSEAFAARFEQNTMKIWWGVSEVSARTSREHFSDPLATWQSIDAAMIDGNHDAPEPTMDAIRAITAGAKVLVWHDFMGKPVRDAVRWVLGLVVIVNECLSDSCEPSARRTWKARVYDTPNGMAVAWRVDCGFVPPDHTPDPSIDWAEIRARHTDFDFGRTV